MSWTILVKYKIVKLILLVKLYYIYRVGLTHVNYIWEPYTFIILNIKDCLFNLKIDRIINLANNKFDM